MRTVFYQNCRELFPAVSPIFYPKLVEKQQWNFLWPLAKRTREPDHLIQRENTHNPHEFTINKEFNLLKISANFLSIPFFRATVKKTNNLTRLRKSSVRLNKKYAKTRIDRQKWLSESLFIRRNSNSRIGGKLQIRKKVDVTVHSLTSFMNI